MNYHLSGDPSFPFDEDTLRCVVNMGHKDAKIMLNSVYALMSIFLVIAFYEGLIDL